MTLGQIKGLKKEISEEIENYLSGLMKIVKDKFDVGEIDVSVRTNVYDVETLTPLEVIKRVEYEAKINFSREDI